MAGIDMARYKNLHNWLMHYNEYTDQFDAALREEAHSLFSNSEAIISSKSMLTLIEIIEKTNGDKDLLTKLIR